MFIHTYDYSVLINHFLQMVLLSSCEAVNSATLLRKHLEQMCSLLKIYSILSKPNTVMLISILFTICKKYILFFLGGKILSWSQLVLLIVSHTVIYKWYINYLSKSPGCKKMISPSFLFGFMEKSILPLSPCELCGIGKLLKFLGFRLVTLKVQIISTQHKVVRIDS